MIVMDAQSLHTFDLSSSVERLSLAGLAMNAFKLRPRSGANVQIF